MKMLRRVGAIGMLAGALTIGTLFVSDVAFAQTATTTPPAGVANLGATADAAKVKSQRDNRLLLMLSVMMGLVAMAPFAILRFFPVADGFHEMEAAARGVTSAPWKTFQTGSQAVSGTNYYRGAFNDIRGSKDTAKKFLGEQQSSKNPSSNPSSNPSGDSAPEAPSSGDSPPSSAPPSRAPGRAPLLNPPNPTSNPGGSTPVRKPGNTGSKRTGGGAGT